MDVNKYNEIRINFQNQYTKNIAPIIRRNKIKQETHNNNVIKIIVVFIMLLVVLAIILDINKIDFFNIPVIFIILFFSGVIFSITKTIWRKIIECEIKTETMPAICKLFGDLKWVKPYYDDSIIRESNLITGYNRHSFDDVFFGTYNNTPFKIYECEFEYESGGGKNRTTTTIFSGIVVEIEFDKEFNSNTVIKPNGIVDCNLLSHLRKTELEDVIFEKKYDVYTDDEVEARYILTPLLMEKLAQIKNIYNAGNISCSFYKNKLLVGLWCYKDMFIINISDKIDYRTQFFTLINEIIAVYKLIDYLKENIRQNK